MKITEEFTAKAINVFELLADKTRLRIMLHLSENDECNVTGLCEALQLPQPTISHHCGLLRRGGLISDERQGKQVVYSIADAMPSLMIDGVKIH